MNRLDYLADILVAERLYCAKWHELNDPMEGYFTMLLTSVHEESGLSITLSTPQNIFHRLDDGPRICSLSKDISDIRMWAHYGGAHKGVAIEIDFSGMEAELNEVVYPPKLHAADLSNGALPDVREILRRKTEQWSYETEYRILTSEEYVSVRGRIRRLIMGRQFPPRSIDILRKLMPPDCRLGRVGLNASDSKMEVQGV